MVFYDFHSGFVLPQDCTHTVRTDSPNELTVHTLRHHVNEAFSSVAHIATYNVQMADATRPLHIAREFVPAALLASYWMHLVRPPKNPHMRKRGCPRKADSAHPANRALIDARFYNFK